MYPVKAIALFAAIMLLAVRHMRGRHPFVHFGIANQVTTVRAALVALLAGYIGQPATSGVAASIVVASTAATVLDGVDGWLARRTRMASKFGERFDMEVDALLLLVLAILAWQHEKAGPWVLVSGLLRYIFLAAGWILPWLARPLSPTFRARTICVVQIGVLILVMLPEVTPPASTWLAAAGLAALTYSFAADTRRLWQRR